VYAAEVAEVRRGQEHQNGVLGPPAIDGRRRNIFQGAADRSFLLLRLEVIEPSHAESPGIRSKRSGWSRLTFSAIELSLPCRKRFVGLAVRWRCRTATPRRFEPCARLGLTRWRRRAIT